MKNVRIVLWFLVATMAAGLAYLTVDWTRNQNQAQSSVSQRPVFGSAFTLVDDKGKPFTRDDMLGKPHALFFGYTHCPDVCPTTLYEAAGWLEKLGKDADKLSFYFITVDPERDTPEIMSEYVAAFDERITGLTGDPEKLAAMLKSYKIFAKKVPGEDGDYSMDHTASVILLDPKGRFFGTIAYEEDGDTAVAKLRRLIK